MSKHTCFQVTSVLQIVAAATVLATERYYSTCHGLQPVSHETDPFVVSEYSLQVFVFMLFKSHDMSLV